MTAFARQIRAHSCQVKGLGCWLTSVTGVQLLEVGDDEHGAVLLLADGPDGVPDQRAVHEAVLVVAQEGVDQVAPAVQHDEFHGPLTGEPPEDAHEALQLLRRGGSHCSNNFLFPC
jgi:hypothetical protein